MSSPITSPSRGLAIATACAGGFLAFLDTTIVNTAFPGIAASFPGASAADLAWVLDAYFIVIAALLVPAGGIADRLGRKRVFIAGLALFTVASALAAAAPDLTTLVAARALQGAGAAVMMAVSLALILPLYPLARRASAVALWGASAALAAASGPPLGGALVELGWRWVFVVNLPLGLAVLLAARSAFAEQRDERMAGLPDLLGAALIMAGLGTLALAILEGGTWGWTSPRVLTAFAASALLLAATAHRCRTHPRPVLDPSLLAIPSFRRANLGLLLLGMAFFSTILANVLFLTGVWGYSVLTAGLAVVPGAVATAAVAVPAARIAERHGHSAVIVPGCLLYVAGMALVRAADADAAFLSLWLPAMILNGAGLGLAFPALAAAALTHVPAEHFGAASAVTNATRQLGGVLGTAVLFAVGAPLTLAAAEDAYLVATLWALGAGLTVAGRRLTLAVVVAGTLVFAGPAAAHTVRDDPDEGGQVHARAAAHVPLAWGPITRKAKKVAKLSTAAGDVTRTAITEPSTPTYRLYDTEPKQAGTLRVAGTTDGADGDLHDLVCGGQRVAANVPSKGGRFEVAVPYGKFKPAACILRAVPYKYDGPKLDTFTGPPVAITYFNARTRVTSVRGEEVVVPLDYELESGHRHGHATLKAGQLTALYGVRPDLDRVPARTWDAGARIDEVVVDGRTAFVGSAVPREDIEGRPYAPRGFDGVRVTAEVDPVSGAVTVVEIARALRCEDKCLEVIDTGVRLERTVTLSGGHAQADVRDRWVSTDGAAHAVRVEYSHGAPGNRWRLPGAPAFRVPVPGEPLPPGPLLVHDGTSDQHMGSLTSDPAPAVAMFTAPDRVGELVTLAAPATVRRLFAVGENLVADDPVPDPPAPTPGAPQDPDTPQPDHPAIYRCVVPKVKAGATVKAAKAAIKAGNCRIGTTRKVRSHRVRKGRVVVLSRRAGSRLPRGAKVGIRVSRGRR